MAPGNDYASRFEMQRARMRALDVAIAKSRAFTTIGNVLTVFSLVAAFAVVWSAQTIRSALTCAVCVIALRWVYNLIVNIAWSRPTMNRIDREHPLPPDLPT